MTGRRLTRLRQSDIILAAGRTAPAAEEPGRMNEVEGAQTPRAQTLASLGELSARDDFHARFVNCPIPAEELLGNLGLFMNRQTLSRLLALHELYRQIIDVHGIVVEFGCRWG